MPNWTPARRNRFILITGLVLIVLVLLWLARGALFPYVFALVLAYLMLPAVNWLEAQFRRRLPAFGLARPLAIILVYLLAIGLLALFFALVVPVITQQFNALWANRYTLGARVQSLAERFLNWYHQNVPELLQVQIEDLLRRASG